jgi:hypothetical protein
VEVHGTRALVVGLIVMNGCAVLKKTEDLPSPLPQDGPGAGPEGEMDPGGEEDPGAL